MKLNRNYYIALTFAIFTMLIIAGCSTQKNTASSRWWHSFNARYNTYYNGTLAYIDGSLEKENGNKDNYTELIPLYTVGNKNSKDIGKSNYERAIEKSEKAIHQHSIKRRPVWDKSRKKTAKDIEWLNRREYNPFIWKAWLLMGRSQFHKGDFEDAASTFSYMSRLYATQPAIYGKARAWLAKCYIEQDWMYDAEDVIRNMQRDSIDWRAQKEWDYTYADFYIHKGDFEKAIPYLRKVIKHEMRRKQKAREWYLLGQLQASLGRKEDAYKSFRHVILLSPPYELAFNARISMTEVLASGQSKKMISKLKRMALSDNNKDYLDQVYYALGNIYLSQKDTINAIAAYEKGNAKATRSGIEKGVLLLHLGDLYWQREAFKDAQRCYGEAIGLLDKDRKDYQQLSDRSKLLDELVPHTEAIHLQDSLQALAKMPEWERNKAIDRVIEALKKKEKEERNAEAESETAEKGFDAENDDISSRNRNRNKSTFDKSNNTAWYFYNPIAVSQGKTAFQRLWGKRQNVDNWQRNNKTVVAGKGAEGMTYQMRDSLANAAEKEDSLKQIISDDQNNPHKRAYYLSQIPFTKEQVDASNKLLEDGLYNAGVIFKDKFDNLSLSEKHLRRLVDDYSDYENLDQAYYHLYLLYSRLGNPNQARLYLEKLKVYYPKSEWTSILTDPYFVENAKFGVHIEDSLYSATYEAFKSDRFNEVEANSKLSAERFPLGANRDKFLFIGGLSKLNNGDASGCLDDMKVVVEKYPNSRISELAGMIVNGVNAGRQLHGGKFDIGDVWERRNEVLNDSDKIKQQQFSTERNTNFMFMVVYKPDSVNENKLLFNLARFNFTTYLVRNFDINIDEQNGLHRMMISGFRNYDEALEYARQFHSQVSLTNLLGKSRTIVISDINQELIGTRFSYNEYDDFYQKHFAPLKTSTYRLLTEPTEIATEKIPEPSAEEIDRALDNNQIDNGLEIQSIEDDNSKVEDTTTIIPEQENKKENTQTELSIPIPAETPAEKEEKATTLPVAPSEKIEKKEKKERKTEDNSTVISIPEPEKKKTEAGSTEINIPEPVQKTESTNDFDTFDIPELTEKAEKKVEVTPKKEEKPKANTLPATKTQNTATSNKTVTPKKNDAVKKNEPVKKNDQTKKPEAKKTVIKTAPQSQKKDDTGIYFDDFGNENNNKKKNNQKQEKKDNKSFDLEDEYYDLGGF